MEQQATTTKEVIHGSLYDQDGALVFQGPITVIRTTVGLDQSWAIEIEVPRGVKPYPRPFEASLKLMDGRSGKLRLQGLLTYGRHMLHGVGPTI